MDSAKSHLGCLRFLIEGWGSLVLQMTATALTDSVSILTKFSEMEQAYSSFNSLRFVKVDLFHFSEIRILFHFKT